MKRLPAIASFILFVALCASAAYWFLQFWRPPVRPVAAPPMAAVAEVPMDVAAGLFGGRPTPVGVASNYQLRGVVVADNGRESVAILSADGKPAQAVGVDTEIQPGVTVREVHPQYVLLSEGGVIKRVALPENARAGGIENGSSAVPSLPPVQPLPQIQPMTPQPPQPSTQPQPPPLPPQVPAQTPFPLQQTPQFQGAPQAATQVVQPVIGQMSNQLSQPVPGQVNAAGQQAVPGMPQNVPVPSGGAFQQRRP